MGLVKCYVFYIVSWMVCCDVLCELWMIYHVCYVLCCVLEICCVCIVDLSAPSGFGCVVFTMGG